MDWQGQRRAATFDSRSSYSDMVPDNDSAQRWKRCQGSRTDEYRDRKTHDLEILAEYLADEKKRVAARTLSRYEDVVELLKHA